MSKENIIDASFFTYVCPTANASQAEKLLREIKGVSISPERLQGELFFVGQSEETTTSASAIIFSGIILGKDSLPIRNALVENDRSGFSNPFQLQVNFPSRIVENKSR